MPIIIDGGCHGGGGSAPLIQTAKLTQDGHLVFTYSDSTEVDAGVLLDQSQLEHLNQGFAATDLGSGLEINEDGKLITKLTVRAGSKETVSEDGVLVLPIADANTPGLMYPSEAFTVDENGRLDISSVDVTKIAFADGDELILSGG